MENIVGQTIVKVRLMTDEEMERMGWSGKITVLVLSNGVLLYPSSDEEGNDAGVIFGEFKDANFTL